MAIGSNEIRALMRERNINQTQLADLLGVKQPTVSRWLGGAMPDPAQQDRIAALIEEGVRGGNVVTMPRAGYNPPPEIFGPRDLPVYASVEGGPGAMVIDTRPVDMVPRPWFFRQVMDGYAVLVNGESMSPVYEPGDMVLVNPKASLVKGKDVILVKGEEDGAFDASLKRLVGQTNAEWLLHQFNPPEGEKHDFRRFKHDWPRALRVVGKYDGG